MRETTRKTCAARQQHYPRDRSARDTERPRIRSRAPELDPAAGGRGNATRSTGNLLRCVRRAQAIGVVNRLGSSPFLLPKPGQIGLNRGLSSEPSWSRKPENTSVLGASGDLARRFTRERSQVRNPPAPIGVLVENDACRDCLEAFWKHQARSGDLSAVTPAPRA